MLRLAMALPLLLGRSAVVTAEPPKKCYWGGKPWCGPYCDTCGPGHEVCGAAFGPEAPTFHLMDSSCGTQDPNAPIYDPAHGVYHMFWQAHTARPCAGDFRAAPSIGHAVSRDLVRWAHMPVAIWNGGSHAYDADAIYSCSATLVDGVPTIVYPGLCESSDWAGGVCQTWPGKGTTLNIATPANMSDPLLSEWTKSPLNPIANRTTDAPSTAWHTGSGEWRFMTSGAGSNWIFSSEDFRTWRHVGNLSSVAAGACPSLFPFPPLTPGVDGTAPANATHVAKASLATPVFHDILTAGSYTAGARGSTGTWTTIHAPVTMDGGQVFAGKDMWDPVKKRRLYWAWAHDVAPASALTLTRAITYHPMLKTFVYSPLEEQALLRGQQLAAVGRTPLPPVMGAATSEQPGAFDRTLWLSKGWKHGDGNATEIRVTFALPSQAARLGVVVMSSTTDGAAPTDGTLFYVDYTPPPAAAQTSPWSVHAGAMDVGRKTASSVAADSQVRTRSTGPPAFWPPYNQELQLLPSDQNLTLTVFVDRTFAECFFAGGRTVLTRSVGRFGPPLAAGVAVPLRLQRSQNCF